MIDDLKKPLGPSKDLGAIQCWATRPGEWSYIQPSSAVLSVAILDNWGGDGWNFRRMIPLDGIERRMTPSEVDRARSVFQIRDTSDGIGFLMISLPMGLV